MPLKIFVDSDVVISSLISQKGAADALFKLEALVFYVSNYSLQELENVIKELKISLISFQKLIKEKFKQVEIKGGIAKIKQGYAKYVFDQNDAHIVAGAKLAKAQFLVTYNLKHFKLETIKRDLGIILLSPAQFMQYQRSLN